MQDESAVQMWRNLRNLRNSSEIPQRVERKRCDYGMLPI